MNFLRLQFYKTLTIVNILSLFGIYAFFLLRASIKSETTKFWLLIGSIPFMLYVLFYCIFIICSAIVVQKYFKKSKEALRVTQIHNKEIKYQKPHKKPKEEKEIGERE